jgi:hypothetical protein
MDQLKLFARKYEVLKISVHLQTAFAAETLLAEGQWQKEQLNVVKLTHVTSRNMSAECSKSAGSIYSK